MKLTEVVHVGALTNCPFLTLCKPDLCKSNGSQTLLGCTPLQLGKKSYSSILLPQLAVILPTGKKKKSPSSDIMERKVPDCMRSK